jgi:hypothetical protein
LRARACWLSLGQYAWGGPRRVGRAPGVRTAPRRPRFRSRSSWIFAPSKRPQMASGRQLVHSGAHPPLTGSARRPTGGPRLVRPHQPCAPRPLACYALKPPPPRGTSSAAHSLQRRGHRPPPPALSPAPLRSGPTLPAPQLGDRRNAPTAPTANDHAHTDTHRPPDDQLKPAERAYTGTSQPPTPPSHYTYYDCIVHCKNTDTTIMTAWLAAARSRQQQRQAGGRRQAAGRQQQRGR